MYIPKPKSKKKSTGTTSVLLKSSQQPQGTPNRKPPTD